MKNLYALIYPNRKQLLPFVIPSNGFTLLELMIVIFILGILSALSIPNMISQVGKAREAEAKQLLSSVAFSQQGYFFEYRQFAPNYDDLGVSFSSQYYDISSPDNTDPTAYTRTNAVAKNLGQSSARSYSMAVYYLLNHYRLNLCQSTNPTTTTQAPTTFDADCSDGGGKIN